MVTPSKNSKSGNKAATKLSSKGFLWRFRGNRPKPIQLAKDYDFASRGEDLTSTSGLPCKSRQERTQCMPGAYSSTTKQFSMTLRYKERLYNVAYVISKHVRPGGSALTIPSTRVTDVVSHVKTSRKSQPVNVKRQ